MESRKLRNIIVHLFALNGCEIPDRRMDSFAIVEKLDIFKNLALRFLAGLELFQINEFLFEYAVERFDAGVVVAVALAAHAALHPVF